MTLIRAEAPEVKANAGIYVVTWPRLAVMMRVDRLYDDSHFNTTAEIWTTVRMADTVGHLDRSRLNLTSSAAKRSFAKALSERETTLPWSDMVEQLTVKVLDLHRQGEPTYKTGDVQINPDALDWRVKPLLIERQPNLVYAHGGTGKSLFAEFLALLVQQTQPPPTVLKALDLEAEPGNVLYLDWETDKETITRRQRAMSRGMGVPEYSHLLYRRMSRPLAHDIEYVQRMVLENDISLVIVDSLAAATGNDLNTDQYVNNFFGALRTLGCTTLTVHHNNREKQMYGNSYIWNQVRSVWALKQAVSDEPHTLALGLFKQKMNDGEVNGSAPITFKVDFNGNMIRWSRTRGANFEEAANDGPGQSTKSQILETIRRAPLGKITPANIAELLDLDAAIVRARLKDLRAAGKVIQLPGDGKENFYGLPTE